MLKSRGSIKSSLYISSTLIAISLLSGAVLSSSSSSADVVDDVVVTVPISCNMASELDEAHTATINPGQYQSDIGTTNFTVFCNDNSGYAIYAIGYSNEEYGNTKMLATINNELSPTNDINTGTTTSGNTSSWSMKLVPVTTASSGTTQPYTPTIESDTNGTFGDYHVVPTEYTKVATFTSNTDFTIGSSLQSTYQVYIDGTKPAGTYAGKVKYTLVHPSDHATPDEFTSETLQSVTNWGGKVAPGQTVTVTDARDGQEYTVARLADGKLWMTKNLRLDIGRANITAENTNNPTQAFLTAISSATSSNEWCTDDNSTCTDQIKYNTSNINDQTTDSEGHKYDEYGVYYNWYTATAGNGAYSTTSNTNVSGDICPSGWHLPTGTDTSVGDPNAWAGDYWNLAAAQDGGIASDNSNYSTITGATGSERLRSSPNNFLYSGNFADNSAFDRGNYGRYWTATKSSYSNAYIAYLSSTSISPGSSGYPAFLGLPIRCIANPIPVPMTINYGEHSQKIYIDGKSVEDGATVRLYDGSIHSVAATFESGYTLDHFSSSIEAIDGQTSNTVFTMAYKPSSLTVIAKPGLILQQVDTWGDSVEANETVHAFDVRDNSEYTVSRLADGKLWMTRNLRLDLESSIITADNTNNPTAAFLEEASTMPSPSNSLWCAGTSYDCIDHIQYSTINIGNNNKDDNDFSIDDYGIYYNWYTATSGNGTASISVETTVTGDICPAGWHLPTLNSSSGDYYNLANIIKEDGLYSDAANVYRFITQPIHMPLAGSIHNNGNRVYPTVQSTAGVYWSATKRDHKDYAYYWFMNQSNMHGNNYGDGQINYGNSVRCLTD